MLKAGDAAPGFELQDDTGATVSLSSLLESGPLVLYFYPVDSTPICTAEACFFRDAGMELAAAGARVVGVSAQGVESKAKFKAQHGLNFPLLADPGKKVARAYGAVGLMGLWPKRVTYVIGRDGRIRAGYCNEFSAKGHAAFVREALRALAADRATGRTAGHTEAAGAVA